MSDCDSEERTRVERLVRRRRLEGPQQEPFWDQLHEDKRLMHLLRFALQREVELHDVLREVLPVLCMCPSGEKHVWGDLVDRILNIRERRSLLKLRADAREPAAKNKFDQEDEKVWEEQWKKIKETRQTALKQTRLRSLLDGKKRQLMEPLYCKLCTARVPLRLLPDHSFSCFQINCYYQDLAQINMKILNLEEKSSRFRVQLRRCLLPSRADKAE
jgi:hypothetical protein